MDQAEFRRLVLMANAKIGAPLPENSPVTPSARQVATYPRKPWAPARPPGPIDPRVRLLQRYMPNSYGVVVRSGEAAIETALDRFERLGLLTREERDRATRLEDVARAVQQVERRAVVRELRPEQAPTRDLNAARQISFDEEDV